MSDVAEPAPLEERTLTDQVVRRLRLDIVAGRLPPGTQLVELRVARDLDISRSTVREALQRLAALGLLEAVPHRGHRVRVIDEHDAAELRDLFALLESHAMRRLALPLSEVSLARLRDLAEDMQRLRLPRDLDAFIELDRRFHGLLITESGHRRLRQLWESQHPLTSLVVASVLRHRPVDGPVLSARHNHLLEVASRGDPAALAAAVSDHYLSAGGLHAGTILGEW